MDVLTRLKPYGYSVFLLIWLLLFVSAGKLSGQRPGTVQRDAGMFSQGRSERGDMKSQDEYDAVTDTFGIFPFYATNPEVFERLSDTSLNKFFHQYDPVRQRDFDYLHLGNLGSAHHPMRFEEPFRLGLDAGLHQFDLYEVSRTSFPFYRLEKAFTNVSFIQAGEQAESALKAQFARNFSDGIHLSLDYRRMNLFGTNKYPEQDARITALGIGLWIQDIEERYQGFLIYAGNTIQQQNSGGIKTPPESTASFNSAQSAEVFLSESETRHDRNSFSYTQYYRLNKIRRDSTGELPGRAYTLGHVLEFQSNKYKYFDLFPTTGPEATDSLHYGSFLVDSRGQRFYLGHRILDNTFSVATSRRSLSAGKGTRIPAGQKDLLELSLQHQLHWLDMDDRDSTLQYLFVRGQLNFTPGPGLDLQTYAHLGLWNQAGDYRISGKLSLGLGSFGRFSSEAINQLYSPTFIEQRMVVDQRILWEQDWKRTLHTTLRARYEHPFTNFSGTVSYHLVNNYLYFNADGKPEQLGTPLSIFQLGLTNHIRAGKFHMENTVLIQQFSEPVVALPELFTKHSLYYEGKWFGVLDVRTGFDLRLLPSYKSPYYFPLTGQFQLQDDFETPFYPALDVFFAMQVSSFRAFAKMEQLAGLIGNEELYYQTAYYAHPASGFRLGITWKFIN